MMFVLCSLVWLGLCGLWLAPLFGLSPVLLALVSGMAWSLWGSRRGSAFQWNTQVSADLSARLAGYQPWALRIGLMLFCLQLPADVLNQQLLQQIWPLLLAVPLTLGLGLWAGRKLGLSTNTSWLVTAGLTFCGTSALFATQSVRRGSATELSQSLAAVLLMGLLALSLYAVLPLAAEPAALLIGATAPEVSQVVAASSLLPASVAVLAILLKLSRVLLLVPFLLLLPLSKRDGTTKVGLPWFPLAVFLAALIGQSGWLPASTGPYARIGAECLLVSAIWLSGVQTDWRAMRQGSVKVLLLALLLLIVLFSWFGLWLVVAGNPAPGLSEL